MSRTPMKRLGEPSEIADTVAYLAINAGRLTQRRWPAFASWEEALASAI